MKPKYIGDKYFRSNVEIKICFCKQKFARKKGTSRGKLPRGVKGQRAITCSSKCSREFQTIRQWNKEMREKKNGD